MTVTMGESLPSLPITTADVPEITTFTAKFYYNFFRPDELTNSNISSAANPNTVEFSRNVPRYIRLSWNKVNVGSGVVGKKEFIDISIQANASKILDEDDLSLAYFDSFKQQESSFVTERQRYLSRLYEQINYNRVNAGLPDAVRALHEITPEGVSQEFLNRYLNYAYTSTTNTTAPDPAMSFENITTVVPVANKVFGTLFHEKLTNDSMVGITPNMVSGLSGLFTTQHTVRAFANRFNGSQYDIQLDNPISTTVTDMQSDFGLVFQTTGYTIDRYRQVANGELIEKTTFFVESPETTEFFDTQVLYNQRYVYFIKVVTALQTLTANTENRVNVISTFLVGSKQTRTIVVCEDVTPPEPPTDFFIRWDYGLKQPVLTWNFPVDTRRHIKYFQVFRRKNVGNVRPAQQPFELVRMFDFNDLQEAYGTFYVAPAAGTSGLFQFLQGEANIDASVVINQNSIQNQDVFSPTCYIDTDFNKEDYYIYAVACIDAHGITSNYSNQVGIKFNKQKNTVDRIDASAPNAPKPYPNLYLNKDVFVDTIKNEGYSQMTVVFNPEYYELTQQNGDNVKIVNFGPQSKYRVQLINTDLQTDQFIDVTVMDDRESV
jgi:hypothetical protein